MNSSQLACIFRTGRGEEMAALPLCSSGLSHVGLCGCPNAAASVDGVDSFKAEFPNDAQYRLPLMIGHWYESRGSSTTQNSPRLGGCDSPSPSTRSAHGDVPSWQAARLGRARPKSKTEGHQSKPALQAQTDDPRL